MFLDTNRDESRHQAELADQEQLREERAAVCSQELQERRTRLDLEIKERQVKLSNDSWRERILLGMTLTCFLCALALMATGMQTSEPYVIGGSGTFGAMVGLLLHLLRPG